MEGNECVFHGHGEKKEGIWEVEIYGKKLSPFLSRIVGPVVPAIGLIIWYIAYPLCAPVLYGGDWLLKRVGRKGFFEKREMEWVDGDGVRHVHSQSSTTIAPESFKRP